MHYKNGREAKVGDVVVGKGYNVKNAKGELATIGGVVVGITPGAGTCNIRIANRFVPWGSNQLQNVTYAVLLANGQIPLHCDIEYGQCDHFLHVEDAVNGEAQ